jgi:hypothetical protein
MCSYCLARFVPFLTPRGGMTFSSPRSACAEALPVRPGRANVDRVSMPAGQGYYECGNDAEGGDEMYIGGGVLALIIIILLLVWLF